MATKRKQRKTFNEINITPLTDIFLVLSWSTKKEYSILTGKFYEGIRAEKPILVLPGMI